MLWNQSQFSNFNEWSLCKENMGKWTTGCE